MKIKFEDIKVGDKIYFEYWNHIEETEVERKTEKTLFLKNGQKIRQDGVWNRGEALSIWNESQYQSHMQQVARRKRYDEMQQTFKCWTFVMKCPHYWITSKWDIHSDETLKVYCQDLAEMEAYLVKARAFLAAHPNMKEWLEEGR